MWILLGMMVVWQAMFAFSGLGHIGLVGLWQDDRGGRTQGVCRCILASTTLGLAHSMLPFHYFGDHRRAMWRLVW